MPLKNILEDDVFLEYLPWGWTLKLLNFFFHSGKHGFLLFITGSYKLLHQDIQAFYYTSLHRNTKRNEFNFHIPHLKIKFEFTYFGSKLSFSISTCSRFLIDKSHKVIQVSSTSVIFTSFVALWEELQGRKSTHIVPAYILVQQTSIIHVLVFNLYCLLNFFVFVTTVITSVMYPPH